LSALVNKVLASARSVPNDVSAAEDFLKCSSKVAVEDGVDDGIESGVAVAEPEEHGEQHRRRLRQTGTCQ